MPIPSTSKAGAGAGASRIRLSGSPVAPAADKAKARLHACACLFFGPSSPPTRPRPYSACACVAPLTQDMLDAIALADKRIKDLEAAQAAKEAAAASPEPKKAGDDKARVRPALARCSSTAPRRSSASSLTGPPFASIHACMQSLIDGIAAADRRIAELQAAAAAKKAQEASAAAAASAAASANASTSATDLAPATARISIRAGATQPVAARESAGGAKVRVCSPTTDRGRDRSVRVGLMLTWLFCSCSAGLAGRHRGGGSPHSRAAGGCGRQGGC